MRDGFGDWPSRYRFGVSATSDSTMAPSGARHSPPPGVDRLSTASAEVHSHATSSRSKLPASIWSSGEYFVPAMSPA